MTTKEAIIKKLNKELPELRKTYHVNRLGIFGSYVNGTQTEKSDIDLVVEYEKEQIIGFQFFDLIDYLQKLFNNKIDLLTIEGIESIRVPKVKEKIKKEIIYV